MNACYSDCDNEEENSKSLKKVNTCYSDCDNEEDLCKTVEYISNQEINSDDLDPANSGDVSQNSATFYQNSTNFYQNVSNFDIIDESREKNKVVPSWNVDNIGECFVSQSEETHTFLDVFADKPQIPNIQRAYISELDDDIIAHIKDARDTRIETEIARNGNIAAQTEDRIQSIMASEATAKNHMLYMNRRVCRYGKAMRRYQNPTSGEWELEFKFPLVHDIYTDIAVDDIVEFIEQNENDASLTPDRRIQSIKVVYDNRVLETVYLGVDNYNKIIIPFLPAFLLRKPLHFFITFTGIDGDVFPSDLYPSFNSKVYAIPKTLKNVYRKNLKPYIHLKSLGVILYYGLSIVDDEFFVRKQFDRMSMSTSKLTNTAIPTCLLANPQNIKSANTVILYGKFEIESSGDLISCIRLRGKLTRRNYEKSDVLNCRDINPETTLCIYVNKKLVRSVHVDDLVDTQILSLPCDYIPVSAMRNDAITVTLQVNKSTSAPTYVNLHPLNGLWLEYQEFTLTSHMKNIPTLYRIDAAEFGFHCVSGTAVF